VYGWLKMGFGLVTGFINDPQVITTINYYIIAALLNLQSLDTNLFGLSALAFIRFITQEPQESHWITHTKYYT
jgi:hypothetical protein